ncbi:hypothetical protein GLOIN_2v1790148 [Rhizophagus clarus]|uniref:Uncharacterized protein n=1 Tax=Rhizophagus clarus TaxID=94130 RepID=A0A8H3QIK5_9GLOM|nr:hypothetical protein GLOIN_2v1790148 [Rhizophagus clarus]
MLRILCDLDFLHPAPSDQTKILWNCIQESLNVNKRGQDEKRHILFIVANQFLYCKIKKNLNIFLSEMINETCKYARLYGPDAERIEKSIFTRTTILHEKLDQVQQFLDDKNNVIISSYKTETKTGLLIKYLKRNQYIYQENLDRLCSICSYYGYKIFAEMKHFIKKNIQNNNLQTLNLVLVYIRKEDSFELNIQAYDYWINDPYQDAWFTISSLYAVIESIKKKSEWVTIISNNGGHYHNADLMMILRHWPNCHHAQIVYSINRHVKLGFDISSEKDTKNAIFEICGMLVSHLKPDRKKESGKERNKLPARDIAKLGTWTSFSLKDLEKLQSKTIEKPNSKLLELFDSDETIDSTCKYRNLDKETKKNHIKKQLEAHDILKDIDTNKSNLIKELKITLAKDILSKIPEDNINKSERHTAESMLIQLKKNAKDRMIEEKEVLKLKIIRNWVSHYASQYCQEAAIVVQAFRT